MVELSSARAVSQALCVCVPDAWCTAVQVSIASPCGSGGRGSLCVCVPDAWCTAVQFVRVGHTLGHTLPARPLATFGIDNIVSTSSLQWISLCTRTKTDRRTRRTSRCAVPTHSFASGWARSSTPGSIFRQRQVDSTSFVLAFSSSRDDSHSALRQMRARGLAF